jgi:hypothetical protein
MKIIVADSCSFVALVKSGALDRLLSANDSVRIAITDHAWLDAIRNGQLSDIAAIRIFLSQHAAIIEIQETSTGKMARESSLVWERFNASEYVRKAYADAGLQPPVEPTLNVGHESITSLIRSLVESPSAGPVTVVVCDDYLSGEGDRQFGNTQVLSLKSFIKWLEHKN